MSSLFVKVPVFFFFFFLGGGGGSGPQRVQHIRQAVQQSLCKTATQKIQTNNLMRNGSLLGAFCNIFDLH